MENKTEVVEEIDFDEFSNKINELTASQSSVLHKIDNLYLKLDTFEKSVISINAELIKQNLKLAEENENLNIQLNSKSSEKKHQENNNISGAKPNETQNEKQNETQNETQNSLSEILTKDLFYKVFNNKVMIYGPGSYDARVIIKTLGASWNNISKKWEGDIDIETLKEFIPNIQEQS